MGEAILKKSSFFFDIYPEGSNTAANDSKIAITPLALIGEIEEEALKKIFYKNPPEEVMRSLDALKLQHFIGEYELYSSPYDVLEHMIPGRGVYVPFSNWMEMEVGDLCRV